MPVPPFQEVMLPILKLASDGQSHSVREIVEYLEQFFQLTEAERQERVPSGQQRTIYNRATWALTHIKKVGLLEPRGTRGSYGIIAVGQDLLATNPSEVNMKMLREYPSYRNFVSRETQATEAPSAPATESTVQTPEEIIGELSEQLNLQLAEDILDEITSNTEDYFEKLVVDLLVKMGYGGLEGKGEVTKKTGDGGIDGVIKQDELGLDSIYIQAKRWEQKTSVGRPEVQKFAGALLGKKATKGVFIATSGFSKNAEEYVNEVPNTKIILIGGLTLARLMIKHDLGVDTSNTIRIKKIDSDYFEEQ